MHFLMLPPERLESFYGSRPDPAPERGTGGGNRTAYAGYAYLQKRSHAEEQQLQAACKAQVRGLYKTRVLARDKS